MKKSSSKDLMRIEIMISPQQGIKIERKDGAKITLDGDKVTVQAPTQTFDQETKTISKHVEYAVFDLSKVFGYKYIEYSEEATIVEGPAKPDLQLISAAAANLTGSD